ncbi:PaaI family thioesterase [Nocardioides mangrovi]|uniref:PaaI family thioesterase n=1 Tax=Nocardioides mangrovi TaxID=2874580 RepID=A0ABS7UDW3_9ACTN|nr:PaaI family thioesterase [Nocardioides mangrovi]MBZ5739186.1 PaaI family thioesterase [Nocardioides mangrovi]
MSLEGFIQDETPTAVVQRREASLGPLAASLRELLDATIRTTVDDEEIRAVRGEVEALVERLRVDQRDGTPGVRFNSEGYAWNWGNAVVGLGNAIAPPLGIVHEAPGRARAEVHLGAAYEGPPGLVHGGVSAMLLDHIMGETAANGFTRITFTGTLTLTYRRGTPLGPLHLEAHIDREEGRKVWVLASIGDVEGPTVEAEGVFIVPAWAG